MRRKVENLRQAAQKNYNQSKFKTAPQLYIEGFRSPKSDPLAFLGEENISIPDFFPGLKVPPHWNLPLDSFST